jgi:hypothetical protein
MHAIHAYDAYEIAMRDSRRSEIHAYGIAYGRWHAYERHAYEMVSVRGMPIRWLMGDARLMR